MLAIFFVHATHTHTAGRAGGTRRFADAEATLSKKHAGLIFDGSNCGLQIRRGLATQRFDSS